MGYKQIFSALAAFSCLLSVARASSENYELITVEHGLPHNIVLSMLQDSEGFIWIGTYNGLCEYNGNRIITHKNVFDTTITQNWFHAIETLFEDSRKNIWIGSRGGIVSCYNRSTQSFRAYPEMNPKLSRISCFFEDDKGQVWLGDMNGRLVRVYPDISSEHISNEQILALGQCHTDTLVVLTSKEVLYYSISKRLVTAIDVKGLPSNIQQGYAFDGKMAAQSDKGFSLVDICSRTVERAPSLPGNLSSTMLSKLLFTKDNRYYFTDAININEYRMNGALIDSFRISDNECYNPNLVLNCLLEDRSGILWLGTNTGLYKVDRKKYKFRKYSQSNISGKISDNYVRALYADKYDDIWIGFKGGKINKLHYDTTRKQYVLHRVYTVEPPHQAVSISAFCPLDNGTILAGGEPGLFAISNSSQQFVRFMPDVIPDSVLEIWALHKDVEGNIWIGTHQGGLYIVSPTTRKLYHYTRHDGSGLTDNAVWTIYRDTDGDVWIGTDNGLCKVTFPYDVSRLRFSEYTLGDKSNVGVWSIVNDKRGNLWIGTTGYGIFRLRNNGRECISYGNRPENVISSIVPDKLGNIWVGTVNGLYQYIYKANKFIRYDESDGLASSDFNFKAATESNTGQLFFGGKTGMISFDPREVGGRRTVSPVVRITSIVVAGRKIPYSPYTGKLLELPHNQNFITISLSIPEYTKPGKHRYRYQLKNFDPGWNYTNNENPQAVYTNIPPGEYRFVIQGSADGQHWGKEETQLLVNIIPAIWQRRVFHILFAASLILAVSLIVYWRVKKRIHTERTRHMVEKRMAELELSALQTQMNPHFIFNTISSIQHFVLNKDEVTAYSYLTKFARLMRLFLESSKNRFITLKMETELLELYLSLEKLRYENKVNYQLIIAPELNLEAICIPPMLLQPFIENAIKHGLANKAANGMLLVEIGLYKDDSSYIHCVIDDNGIGREQSARIKKQRGNEHISRGMEIVAERIKTYNFISGKTIIFKIVDKSHPEVGTKVEMFIPVSRCQ
ncbi:MAG TPA: two-component regulator propeller domain-containing protein [Flavipsychrobacter sp.]